jgi:predicted exporter
MFFCLCEEQQMSRESPNRALDLSHKGMQRWRTDFIRTMLLYAALAAALFVGAAYLNGMMWDRVMAKFATKPFKTIEMLTVQSFVMLVLLGLVCLCLETAWDTWKFSRKMNQLHPLGRPDGTPKTE